MRKKIAVRLFAIAKGSLALKGLLIHVRFFIKSNSITSGVFFNDVSLDIKEGSAMAAQSLEVVLNVVLTSLIHPYIIIIIFIIIIITAIYTI